VTPELFLDAGWQGGPRGGQRLGTAAVRDGDAGAALGAHAHGCLTGAAQPDHEHGLAAEIHSASSGLLHVYTLGAVRRIHQNGKGLAKAPKTGSRAKGRYLTFSVRTRPRTAHANDTIQNRTTMRDSGQPSFSKWWWMGAIRKMRFLVRL
jgi:hypothetical protein